MTNLRLKYLIKTIALEIIWLPFWFTGNIAYYVRDFAGWYFNRVDSIRWYLKSL